MQKFKATAPARNKEGHPTFNGKTCGIQFTKNVAIFDDLSLTPDIETNYLGVEGSLSVHIATKLLQDFHYQVEVHNGSAWVPFIPHKSASATSEDPATPVQEPPVSMESSEAPEAPVDFTIPNN